MKLWQKILLGLFLGIFAGWSVAPLGLESYTESFRSIGDVFMNLIRMLVVLLVFSSMTVGVTSIQDPKKLGRVGLKSLFLYLITTIIAICIGLGFAYLMRPGDGVEFTMSSPVDLQAAPSIGSMMTSIIPSNPVASLAEGNVLQIIVFAVFLGISINAIGEKGKPLLNFLESLSEAMFGMTNIIMEFAPYGVFAIMAWVVSSFGLKVLGSLAFFLACNYVACLTHTVLVLGGILIFVAKLNPWNFFKGMGDAIVLAFSTNSSNATLPVSLRCVQDNLGVSKNISNFVLPLGATVNMNGAAISQAITAVFISQAYGIELEWQALLTIVVTATLSAIGAAGIPGTTLVMLTVVLTSVGLPLEGILLVSGVDRIREMVTTIVNILGDSVVAVYVAKTEGELDLDVYNRCELVAMEREA
ncbi:MAG: DAACS family dicarboxylate/amino acid:cation (Na+ or H+) symporter [Chlamydiales bacterium]|jgi:DAACS family dicarboxylate/amino acid:cation (Na+ or H+) symporter